jgi:hypothetical protein
MRNTGAYEDCTSGTVYLVIQYQGGLNREAGIKEKLLFIFISWGKKFTAGEAWA